VTLVATVAALSLLGSPCASASTRHPTGIRVPRVFFGLHDGSLASYGHLTVGSVRLWDAGVSWRDVETAPGVYDWSRLDALVAAARRHGVEVTLVLAMTPSFYGPSSTSPPTDLARFADYVRAVMTRYRDVDGSRGIENYQVWNEGNVSTFWTGTPHQLAQLTRVVDEVRDQVDPHARVVAPSFAVRLPYEQRWMAEYEAQRLDGVPVWRYVDANAPSLYPKAVYGHRIGGPEDAMRLLSQVRRRLADVGVPAGLPVWGSELNYGVESGSRAATPISERRQVANVMRTYLLGAARGLARVFWYRYDWGYVPSLGGTLGNTLLTVPGSWDQVTPAGRALDTVQRWLHGRLVGVHRHRPCARDRRGTYTCVVRYAAGTRTIMWNPTRLVRVDVRGAAYRQTAGTPPHRVGARTVVRVGYEPVMLVRRR
jgi:hypothetical protein